MSNNYGPRIVTDGLVLCLDAADRNSYAGSGSTWYDLSGNNAHAEAYNTPIFTDAGPQSYWEFGTDDKFNSVNISQEYRDLLVVFKLEANIGTSMIFGHYNNYDDSFRLYNGSTKSSTDSNDWENGELSKTFINGSFNAGGSSLLNRWVFARVYRSNTIGFGTSFRYEISSDFYNRNFIGKMNYIACYNRELDNTEVLQNYNALKGRFGL